MGPSLRLLLGLLIVLCTVRRVRADEGAFPIALSDVTVSAGLEGVRGDRFSFGDYDQDGDPDLLVNGTTLLRNATTGFGTPAAAIRFEDVSAASGMAKGPGGGACWVDLDRDGDLDVVTVHGGVKIQVEAGRFVDTAAQWGLDPSERMASLGVGDFDGDGFHDLLFGGGEKWANEQTRYFPRVLLRNDGGKRFIDVTKDHDLAEPRYGRAVVWADYDLDGDLDVYLANYRLMANELLVNEDGRLTNRAKASGVEGRFSTDRVTLPNGQTFGYRYGHSIAASWADLDADGDLDLWVSNLVHKFAGLHQGQMDIRGWICDDSAIYRNEGPPGWTFTDARAGSGIPLMPTGDRDVYRGDELWSNAAIADLDLDGLPEVLVNQVYELPYSHSLLFWNRGGLRFEEVSEATGVRRFGSYGAAFADIDGDGDADLVVNGRPSPKSDSEVKLYRNDTARRGAWIAFRLEGESGDPRPLGAQVVLEGEGWRMAGQVEGAMGSHTQQNEGVVRFGLGARVPRAAWIRWPGGVVQRVDEAVPGRVHTVRLPKRDVPALRLAGPRAWRGGKWELRARARAPLGWMWCFDLDGDRVFETAATSGKVTVEAPGPREVRVRLWHERWGLGREGVWRLGGEGVDGTR